MIRILEAASDYPIDIYSNILDVIHSIDDSNIENIHSQGHKETKSDNYNILFDYEKYRISISVDNNTGNISFEAPDNIKQMIIGYILQKYPDYSDLIS